ncbi:MAG: anti-sigma regulatory factor [Chromatiaceae bacterium]|nr:anti-sigma regulatory factor [Chromatiaceae bacterium]
MRRGELEHGPRSEPHPHGVETAATPDSLSLSITVEADIMAACREARLLAERAGLDRTATYHVATAVAELATNLVRHAGGGRLSLRRLLTPPGVELIAEDRGPGITDLRLALSDGYSSAGSLGCGLPGVRRLMDTFSIRSAPGEGTRIEATKWIRP